ncbi:MAG: OadG family protein [Firmicutes bacterium]|nr:OadG family protein [Bacillota bacterium]
MNNSEINENINTTYKEEPAVKGIAVSDENDDENFDALEYSEKIEMTEVSSDKEITNNTSMSEGLAIAAAGFIIVFFVLVLISIILSLLKYANTEKKEEVKEVVSVPEIKEEENKEVIIEEAAEEDVSNELELVAVITACIAASMNTSADKLVVRSIRKTKQWNIEAKYEQQRINYLS